MLSVFALVVTHVAADLDTGTWDNEIVVKDVAVDFMGIAGRVEGRLYET